MKKTAILTLLITCLLSPLLHGQSVTQNDSCSKADPFCGSAAYTYPATTGMGDYAEPGPNYGCLAMQRNPAWFFLQIGNSGDIVLKMFSTPSKDIDFICWGPFTSPTGGCESGLTAGNTIDCSYSGDATEYCEIYGALSGQFYMLLITNYSNNPCNISVLQDNWNEPGAGTTNCNIVIECSILSLDPDTTLCDPSTNTYDLSGNIEFSNAPANGMLTITEQSVVPPRTLSFPAPFTSPQAYSFPDIWCDGLQHTLTATFTDSNSCSLTQKYSAPDAVCPTAVISGGGTFCGYPGANTTVQIAFAGAPPFDFTYAIDGVNQPPVTNFNGPFPYVITADSTAVYTMVSVSNAACVGTVSGTATVTVNPLPVVNITPFSPTCLNTAPFPLTEGNPSGGTYLGHSVISGDFYPTTAGLGTDTVIYVYSDANGCINSDTALMTVNPNPVLTITNNTPSLCAADTTDIHLSADLTGTTFSWTASCASANITGFSSGTGDSIKQVLVNSGYTPETVRYIITGQNLNCFSQPETIDVTVNPVPDLSNSPAAKAICDNTGPNVTLTSHVANTQFTWTCTASSANVTGFSDNTVPTTTLDQTLDNTGYDIENVTYHLTPIANDCYGPVMNYTVTVYPTADLSNFPLSKPICDSTNTNITLTSNVASTQFTWTCSPSSANVTGWANNADSTITLDQTLDNTGYNIETVTYHILPAANLCNGEPANFVVTVNPTANLSNDPPSNEQCDSLPTNITLTSDVAGTQFTWTCSPSSANVTGWSDNALPTTTLDQTLDNIGSDIETVTYYITASANNCQGLTTEYTVTVNPTATVTNDPLSQEQCDGLNTNVMLTSDVAGTQYTWTCTPSSASITGWSDQPTLTGSILQTLDNTGYNTETVTYHLTPSANNCTGTPANYLITVRPTPDLSNAPATQEQCDSVATNITLTSHVAGTQFTWTCIPSSANITGYADNSIPTTLLDQTLDNIGYNIETVTYRLTPSAHDCDGPDTNYVVTINPTPDLSNSPAASQICDSATLDITLTSHVTGTQFTWTCTASSANVTGFSDNTVPTTTLDQTLDNTGHDIETVTYHLTPIANDCFGPVMNYTVTVYPTADLSNFPLSKPICDSTNTNITLTSNVAGTQFTWTCTASSANITGFSDNAVPTVTLDQTLKNIGFTPETVTYHILPAANLCNGEPANFVVTVNPTANLFNDPPSKTQCDSLPTNITLTSDVAGTQFTWTCTPSSANVTGWSDNALPTTTLDQTLDNIGSDIETVTYYITASANNCQGLTTEYTVTVNPTATVTNDPLSQEQCDGLNTNVVLTSDVVGTQYTWTCTPSSASITGWSDQPTLTGSILQTLDNTGYNTETVNYHLTPSANNCTGTPANYLITVRPTPDLSNAPATQEQCDSLATNITLTSHVAGTQFTWTCTASSANITGYADNSTPTTLLDQTLDNTGYNIETVTYRLTPSAHNCDGADTNYVVTINPTPDLSNLPPASQICDSATLNLTLTSHVTGTSFTWTCTPSSANITGWSDNAVPTIALNQTLNNLGLNVENVVYYMTPAAYGCNGPIAEYAVTVVPSPDVSFTPSAQTICSGETSNITVSSTIPSATFTWTVVSSSPNLSGQSDGSGPLIAQTITNTGNTIEHLTYTVTPEAWSCPPGPSRTVVLTVNPRPIVNNSTTTFPICSAGSTNIIPTSSVPGSTFAWTASGSSADVTGFSDGAGPSIVQSLTNTGYNIEAVTYQVTATANSCPGNATPFVVTVFPVANVVFTPNGQTFCSGQTATINLSSHVAGTSYTWTATGSGASLSGYSDGSGDLIQQTLTNSGPYPQTATYLVAPTANACPGTNNSVVVTVNPYPAVTFSLCKDPVVSFNAQPITLKGALPLGGTYSGAGVASGIFDPSSAGTGTHMITYNYVNSWLCSSSAVDSITVVAIPAFNCGNPLTDVRDGQVYSTVKIGTQCWFADNLNYGNTLRSGLLQRDNCIVEKYCFNDNTANCTSLGGMYQWDELMKYEAKDGAQGLCPPEWHVPTETDWTNLFNFYVSNGFAGSPLKNTGYSGFDAFLLGTRFNNVQWDFSTFAVMFWSSTSHGPKKAWAHGMNEFNPSVSYYPSHRNNAFFTRCIKD